MADRATLGINTPCIDLLLAGSPELIEAIQSNQLTKGLLRSLIPNRDELIKECDETETAICDLRRSLTASYDDADDKAAAKIALIDTEMKRLYAVRSYLGGLR